jgi:hypothetical protein
MTGKQTYDSTFRMLAQMDKLGKLKPEQKAEAIKLGTIYMDAHNSAVDALVAGKEPVMSTVQIALDAFLAYAKGLK